MDPLHAEVSRFLAHVSLGRERPLLAAVSAGADSVALLEILAGLGQRLGVAHVHHGLRGAQADQDQEFARARARGLGVPFHAARVDAGRRDGRSPEARARELRYAALEALRADAGYHAVATAHTLDDQAETVLLRASRGSAPEGLGGIEPATRDGLLVRPLLGVRRAKLRSYLRSRGIGWREDSSNRDRRVPRNALRHGVLPLLERVHPGASRKLAELAESARALEAWLETCVERTLAAESRECDGGRWIRRDALRELPPPLRARVLARLLADACGAPERIARRHLLALAAFARNARPGARWSLPVGVGAFCDRDAIWIGAGSQPAFPGPFEAPLHAPAPLRLPERDLELVWQPAGEGLPDSASELCVPRELEHALVARNPLPGERIAKGREIQPLQELFSAARWSQQKRARAVVVARDNEVIWIVGLAPAAGLFGRGKAIWQLVARPLSRVPASC